MATEGLETLLKDFSNGYLIAEIFSWYYPEDIQMHSFVNGTSLAVKLSNWSMLGKFFTKRNLKPTRELIDGTIHCKPGAAEIFVQDIYTMLTNRRIKKIQEEEVDFTDRIYQNKLPMVARSTASRAIKNNLSLTEVMVEPNIYRNKQKINAIIDIHLQRRTMEREQNPARFGIKPTLGERAIRRPSVLAPSLSTTNLQKEKSIPVPNSLASTEIRGKMGVHFKTIQVKQAEKYPFDMNTLQNKPIFLTMQKKPIWLHEKHSNDVKTKQKGLFEYKVAKFGGQIPCVILKIIISDYCDAFFWRMLM